MTKNSKHDSRRHFLRRGLTGTLAALGGLGGFAMRRARAQDFPKMTLEQAGYQDNSTAQPCVSCTLFEPPDGCKIVQGSVSPSGTCNYFTQ